MRAEEPKQRERPAAASVAQRLGAPAPAAVLPLRVALALAALPALPPAAPPGAVPLAPDALAHSGAQTHPFGAVPYLSFFEVSADPR